MTLYRGRIESNTLEVRNTYPGVLIGGFDDYGGSVLELKYLSLYDAQGLMMFLSITTMPEITMMILQSHQTNLKDQAEYYAD